MKSIENIETFFENGQPTFEFIKLLDTLNSKEEIGELKQLLIDKNINWDNRDSLLRFYINNIERWGMPEEDMSCAFVYDCERTLARLNTPEKRRILLRAADFCEELAGTLTDILEHILCEYEKGNKTVVISKKTFDSSIVNYYEVAHKLAGHIQIQIRTLIDIVFPGLISRGVGPEGYHFTLP